MTVYTPNQNRLAYLIIVVIAYGVGRWDGANQLPHPPALPVATGITVRTPDGTVLENVPADHPIRISGSDYANQTGGGKAQNETVTSTGPKITTTADKGAGDLQTPKSALSDWSSFFTTVGGGSVGGGATMAFEKMKTSGPVLLGWIAAITILAGGLYAIFGGGVKARIDGGLVILLGFLMLGIAWLMTDYPWVAGLLAIVAMAGAGYAAWRSRGAVLDDKGAGATYQAIEVLANDKTHPEYKPIMEALKDKIAELLGSKSPDLSVRKIFEKVKARIGKKKVEAGPVPGV